MEENIEHLLMLCLTHSPFSNGAPVAQLDRASDYGSEGFVFESRRVHFESERFAEESGTI